MPRNTPSASSSFEATSDYQYVAAGTTKILQGQQGVAGGKINDYLRIITFCPVTVNPGAVTLQDGNGTVMTLFPGGTSSIVGLSSWQDFLDLTSKIGGWTLVVGANINVLVSGEFQ